MTDIQDFVAYYVTANGPSTAPEMAAAHGCTATAIRQTAALMAARGELVRFGTTTATNASGEAVGGPRAVLWALPSDSEGSGDQP